MTLGKIVGFVAMLAAGVWGMAVLLILGFVEILKAFV